MSAAGNEAANLDSRLWAIPAQSGNGMAISATGPYGLTNFDRPASYTNYIGGDSFKWMCNDGVADSSTGTVTLPQVRPRLTFSSWRQ